MKSYRGVFLKLSPVVCRRRWRHEINQEAYPVLPFVVNTVFVT